MEFELYQQLGDGSIRLSYKDYMHGEDRVFVLLPDGTACEAVDDDGHEVLTPVNIVLALRAMIEKVLIEGHIT